MTLCGLFCCLFSFPVALTPLIFVSVTWRFTYHVVKRFRIEYIIPDTIQSTLRRTSLFGEDTLGVRSVPSVVRANSLASNRNSMFYMCYIITLLPWSLNIPNFTPENTACNHREVSTSNDSDAYRFYLVFQCEDGGSRLYSVISRPEWPDVLSWGVLYHDRCYSILIEILIIFGRTNSTSIPFLNLYEILIQERKQGLQRAIYKLRSLCPDYNFKISLKKNEKRKQEPKRTTFFEWRLYLWTGKKCLNTWNVT